MRVTPKLTSKCAPGLATLELFENMKHDIKSNNDFPSWMIDLFSWRSWSQLNSLTLETKFVWWAAMAVCTCHVWPYGNDRRIKILFGQAFKHANALSCYAYVTSDCRRVTFWQWVRPAFSSCEHWYLCRGYRWLIHDVFQIVYNIKHSVQSNQIRYWFRTRHAWLQSKHSVYGIFVFSSSTSCWMIHQVTSLGVSTVHT